MNRLKKWAPWILAIGFVTWAAFGGPAISGSNLMGGPIIDSVFINNIPIVNSPYGGGTLPSNHSAVVQGIRFHVRTAGANGSTNMNFQVSDGTNTCNCAFACNQSTGAKHASCAAGAGTGCSFAPSAAITYAFTSVGDCSTTAADITNNLTVEGVWQ